jgi:hypothetical protein
MKRKTRTDNKTYCIETPANAGRGGCLGKGQCEIVDPGAYTEAVLHPRQSNFHKTSDQGQN